MGKYNNTMKWTIMSICTPCFIYITIDSIDDDRNSLNYQYCLFYCFFIIDDDCSAMIS